MEAAMSESSPLSFFALIHKADAYLELCPIFGTTGDLEMNSLENRLRELAASADSVFLSPTTLRRLREQGIDIPEPRRLSPEESVNVLFSDERKEHALQMLRQLPDRPDIPVSSIQTLYSEIRAAIVLGSYGGAITLSGILVEYALKYAAYKVEMGGFAKYDAAKWNEFEKLDFGRAITRADKNRLLTKDARELLHDLRVRFRNPYNHYNIRKITSNYYQEAFTSLDIRENQVEVRDVAAKDNPIVQAAAKPLADADNVLPVYASADSVVKYLWNKIKDLPTLPN